MRGFLLLNLFVISCIGLSFSTVIRSFKPRNSRAAKNSAPLTQRSLCTYNGAKTHKTGEFYHLPNTITPNRYRLRFRMDLHRQKLYGHSMISIYIHNQTNIIELNSVKLIVNGASFRTKNIRGKWMQ